MYKILICDSLSDTAIKILKESPDIDFTESFGLSEENLCEKIPAYNAVIVRSATTITAKILEKAENLKAIGRAGSGLDNVDVENAAKKGIKVFNTPGTNAPAVAELTIGLLFSLARNIPAANQSLKEGRWAKKDFSGIELNGKTIGIIGCGTIGKMVAQKAAALGMDVVIYNRSAVTIDRVNFTQIPLDKLLQRSDFISLHLPKSSKTNGLIGAAEISKMKKSAYLINTARGGIVVEKALLSALNNGHIAGAALDVFESEPDFNKELARHNKVIATPHIGAASLESQERVGVLIVDQVLEYLRSKYIFF